MIGQVDAEDQMPGGDALITLNAGSSASKVSGVAFAIYLIVGKSSPLKFRTRSRMQGFRGCLFWELGGRDTTLSLIGTHRSVRNF